MENRKKINWGNLSTDFIEYYLKEKKYYTEKCKIYGFDKISGEIMSTKIAIISTELKFITQNESKN